MLNKDQHWYIQAGFKFSILWISLILFLSLFDITQEYIGLVITVLIAMWGITFINVWIFKDDKPIQKIKVRI